VFIITTEGTLLGDVARGLYISNSDSSIEICALAEAPQGGAPMTPPRTTRQGDGEQQRGKPRSGMISGQTFKNRKVTYSPVGNEAVFEGDIILGRTAELEANLTRGHTPEVVAHGVGITGFRWPGGLVPFQISADLPDPKRVRDAIAHWTAKTHIRFVERTGANANRYRNYVEFVKGDGCKSEVGMQGGRQVVNLGPECGVGNAIHEIGHTLGLWHEQSREDRDQFIEILWANIDPDLKHNFDQHIQDGDDWGSYDYGSIMHYPKAAFNVNGQDTIRPKQAGVAIGQRDALSAGDVAAIQSMYPHAAPGNRS
jgi:hypothetical protein